MSEALEASLGLEGYTSWLLNGQPTLLAVDTETDRNFKAFCVTVAWEGEAHYFPLPKYRGALQDMFTDATFIFHNAKFDLGRLIEAGVIRRSDIDPFRFHDTETICHLLDEHRPRALKKLAREILGEETDEEAVLKEARRKLKLKKDDGYDKIPRDILIPYARADADFTFRIFERLNADFLQVPALSDLYLLERELTLALLDMERAGMGLDNAYLDVTVQAYRSQLLAAELAVRDLVGREDFNPYSPVQVKEALGARGVEVESTSAPVLNALNDDELVRALLELRKIKKILTTYLEALQRERKGNILYPNFRQHGTKTGRMSSGSVEE